MTHKNQHMICKTMFMAMLIKTVKYQKEPKHPPKTEGINSAIFIPKE